MLFRTENSTNSYQYGHGPLGFMRACNARDLLYSVATNIQALLQYIYGLLKENLFSLLKNARDCCLKP